MARPPPASSPSAVPTALSQWDPRVRWVLTRNPDWQGPEPWFEFVVVENYKAVEIAFEVGELDMTRLATDSVPRVMEHLPEDTKIVQESGTQWTWLGMNTEHPLLLDIRVLRAIQSAVDVDSIPEATYDNVSPKAHGIITPGLTGHRTDSNIAYDPDTLLPGGCALSRTSPITRPASRAAKTTPRSVRRSWRWAGDGDAIVDPERCAVTDAALEAGGSSVQRITYSDA